jgi:hypothetical protein
VSPKQWKETEGESECEETAEQEERVLNLNGVTVQVRDVLQDGVVLWDNGA